MERLYRKHQYQLISIELYCTNTCCCWVTALMRYVFTSCRAGSRGACADPLYAGSPWNKCHIQTVWSLCVSCCGWSGWSFGWTLYHTLGTCGAFHLQNRTHTHKQTKTKKKSGIYTITSFFLNHLHEEVSSPLLLENQIFSSVPWMVPSVFTGKIMFALTFMGEESCYCSDLSNIYWQQKLTA